MARVPTQLRDLSEKLKSGEQASTVIGVRELLRWFGAQRRGYYVVRGIRKTLKELGLETVPDFDSMYSDGEVKIIPADGAKLKASDEKPAGDRPGMSQGDSSG